VSDNLSFEESEIKILTLVGYETANLRIRLTDLTYRTPERRPLMHGVVVTIDHVPAEMLGGYCYKK
jgi:hypothetical protein